MALQLRAGAALALLLLLLLLELVSAVHAPFQPGQISFRQLQQKAASRLAVLDDQNVLALLRFVQQRLETDERRDRDHVLAPLSPRGTKRLSLLATEIAEALKAVELAQRARVRDEKTLKIARQLLSEYYQLRSSVERAVERFSDREQIRQLQADLDELDRQNAQNQNGNENENSNEFSSPMERRVVRPVVIKDGLPVRNSAAHSGDENGVSAVRVDNLQTNP